MFFFGKWDLFNKKRRESSGLNEFIFPKVFSVANVKEFVFLFFHFKRQKKQKFFFINLFVVWGKGKFMLF